MEEQAIWRDEHEARLRAERKVEIAERRLRDIIDDPSLTRHRGWNAYLFAADLLAEMSACGQSADIL